MYPFLFGGAYPIMTSTMDYLSHVNYRFIFMKKTDYIMTKLLQTSTRIRYNLIYPYKRFVLQIPYDVSSVYISILSTYIYVISMLFTYCPIHAPSISFCTTSARRRARDRRNKRAVCVQV